MKADHLQDRANARREARAERSGTLGRVLENVGWLLAGKGVGALLSLIYLAIATRTLGPQLFGQFVLILGTAQFVSSFVSFQTWQATVRYGMSHVGQDFSPVLSRLITFCLALDIGGALVGCLIAAAGVFLLGPSFGWSSDLQIAALLFSIVMLLSIRSTAVGILRLHDQFARGAAADTAMPVTRLIGALLVLLAGPTVVRFLIAWAVSEVMTALAYWLLASRTKGWSLRSSGLRGIKAAPGEHPGLWYFVFITNVGGTLASVSKQFVVLAVGLVAGPAAAGAYRLAHQLGQALARVSDLLSRAMFAELARVHAGGGPEQIAKLFRSGFKLALGAGATIAALLLLVGEPILKLVAGQEFAGAYPLLLLLGFAAAVDLVGVSFEPALMATGRAGKAFQLRLAVTLFLLVLLAIMLPLWGALGAAVATLTASVGGLLLFGFVSWRAIHD